jgi:hypothetical protein
MTKDELSEDGATWNLPGDPKKSQALSSCCRHQTWSDQKRRASYQRDTYSHHRAFARGGWSRPRIDWRPAMLEIARKER